MLFVDVGLAIDNHPGYHDVPADLLQALGTLSSSACRSHGKEAQRLLIQLSAEKFERAVHIPRGQILIPTAVIRSRLGRLEQSHLLCEVKSFPI